MLANQEHAIDGSVVEVIRNYLIAVAQEMRGTLLRTACSPVIYEVLDFCSVWHLSNVTFNNIVPNHI